MGGVLVLGNYIVSDQLQFWLCQCSPKSILAQCFSNTRCCLGVLIYFSEYSVPQKAAKGPDGAPFCCEVRFYLLLWAQFLGALFLCKGRIYHILRPFSIPIISFTLQGSINQLIRGVNLKCLGCFSFCTFLNPN